MRVLLTGANGAIGSRVTERLLERGHQVVATTHARHGLARLRSLGAEAWLIDELDPVSVGETVGRAGPDVIVHELPCTSNVDTRSIDHLLSAAQAAGVHRFVVQSHRASRAIEVSVLETPLQALVLRYGDLYGTQEFGALADRVRSRRLPLVGEGCAVWSWVHVDDAAAATVAAIDRGPRGIYDIVDDDPAPVAEWLTYLAAVLGGKEPRRVPTWLGRLLVGEATTRRLTESRDLSNIVAKKDLDWRPAWGSWRDGFLHVLEPPRRRASTARQRAAQLVQIDRRLRWRSTPWSR